MLLDQWKEQPGERLLFLIKSTNQFKRPELVEFLIVMPKEWRKHSMFSADFQNLLLRCSTVETSVVLPQWEEKVEVNCVPFFKDIGMSAFTNPSVCSLPGIHPEAYLESGTHSVKIEVSTGGTEASAITDLHFELRCATITPKKEKVIVDRLFYYLISGWKREPIFFGQLVGQTVKNCPFLIYQE